MRRTGALALAAAAMLGASSARAADAPEFPDTWVNGGPYTMAGLKGKLVVLYFFEEG